MEFLVQLGLLRVLAPIIVATLVAFGWLAQPGKHSAHFGWGFGFLVGVIGLILAWTLFLIIDASYQVVRFARTKAPVARARLCFQGAWLVVLAGLYVWSETPEREVPEDEKAYIAFLHGRIHTFDERDPQSEALTTGFFGSRGQIGVVGDMKHVQPYIGAATRIVDLNGRTLIPGLHDLRVDQGTLYVDELRALGQHEAKLGVSTIVHVPTQSDQLAEKYVSVFKTGLAQSPDLTFTVTARYTGDHGSDPSKLREQTAALHSAFELPIAHVLHRSDASWENELRAGAHEIRAQGFHVLIEAPDADAVRVALDALKQTDSGPSAGPEYGDDDKSIGALFGVTAICESDAKHFAARRLGAIASPWTAGTAASTAACGGERVLHFPFDEITRAGGHVILSTYGSGTDSPWRVMRAVVLGESLDATHTLLSDRKVTWREAIEHFSYQPEVIFAGKHHGPIRGGNTASFVVLDRDPFSTDAAPGATFEVLMTVSSGAITYEKPGAFSRVEDTARTDTQNRSR